MGFDLIHSIRTLARQPGFALLAILTLGAGLGGAASLFSFINAWVIEPLPFEQPERLTHIRSLNLRRGYSIGVSLPDFTDIRQQAQTLESIAAWTYETYALSLEVEPERIRGSKVSTNFFDMLGVQPALGRTFRPEEGEFGKHLIAIVSNGFWKTRLGSRPDAIGTTLRLNGELHTIAGVLPEQFQFVPAGRVNVWTPLAVSPANAIRRQDRYATLVGRLKWGVAAEQSAEELKRIAAGLAQKYPNTNLDVGSYSIPLTERVGEEAGNRIIFIVFGITMGLLLIACSNVTNLLVVRAIGRRRQAAIQFSIGATHGHLIRQNLTETLVIFTASALIGAMAGWWITDWISGLIPFENRGYLPNYGVVTLHWRVFVFALGTALLTGIAFGLAPALENARTDVNSLLKESGSAVSQSRARGWLRGSLVITQIVLATILLASTGSLVRGFRSLWSEPNGFDAKSVLTFEIALDEKKFSTPERQRIFYDHVADGLSPLVHQSVPSVARHIPFGNSNSLTTFQVAGQEPVDPRRQPTAFFNSVTPAYFATMRIPLIAGRDFERRDTADAPLVAIASEAFAKQFFADKHPLGQRLMLGRMRDRLVEIVGIAADVRQDLTVRAREPIVYVPFAQSPSSDAFVLLRAESDPLALLPAARKKVAEIDREEPIFNAKLLADWMNERFSPYKIVAGMVTGFGSLALVLAAIGLYGIVAFSVSQRTREIGIRAALGAEPSHLLRMVMRQGLILLSVGLVTGALAAAAVIIWLRSALADVVRSGSMMPILLTVVFVLASVTMLATLIPARRAASTDPAQATRYD
jgi:putative ABC transport system permease protein